MTLGRTSSGAIKLKTDGGLRAVECACCGGPGCCMFPAPDVAYWLDLFPSYLPESITIDGASVAKNGTSYGNTTNGIILETGSGGDIWARYKNGVRSTRSCLISELYSDISAFADSYLVTPSYSIIVCGINGGLETSVSSPTRVQRVTLCLWEGTDSCGGTVQLFFDQFYFGVYYYGYGDYFLEAEGSVAPCYRPTLYTNGKAEEDGGPSVPLGRYTASACEGTEDHTTVSL